MSAEFLRLGTKPAETAYLFGRAFRWKRSAQSHVIVNTVVTDLGENVVSEKEYLSAMVYWLQVKGNEISRRQWTRGEGQCAVNRSLTAFCRWKQVGPMSPALKEPSWRLQLEYALFQRQL